MGLILCFLQSCSTEEVLLEREANIKTVTKEEAIQYLKQNPLKTNGTKAEKITAYLNYGAITQEKITNSNQLVTVIPLSNNNIQQSSRVLLLKVNDTLKSAVFTMYPDGEVKTKEFSGRIMIIGIDGEFINGFRVKDGFLISQFTQKTPSKQSTRIANKATAVYSTEPIQLDEVIIPPRKKATIQINYIFDWSSAYDNTYPSGMEWDFSESSGGGGGAAAEAEPVVEEEEDFEDKINSDELNGKTKCINDLLNKKDSSYVKSLLSNFEGESEFNIKIVSQDVIISNVSGKPINGSTTEPVNSVIVIKISTSQANLNPNLVVARTILHEYIYADIYRKLKTNNASLPEIQDFKKIFELYADNLDKDHSAMADLYLNSMIAALKEFHKMQLPNDYNAYINYYGEEPNDAFYEGLAWVGLKDNNVDAWVKLSEAKKEEIKNMGSRIDKLGKISPCTN